MTTCFICCRRCGHARSREGLNNSPHGRRQLRSVFSKRFRHRGLRQRVVSRPFETLLTCGSSIADAMNLQRTTAVAAPSAGSTARAGCRGARRSSPDRGRAAFLDRGARRFNERRQTSSTHECWSSTTSRRTTIGSACTRRSATCRQSRSRGRPEHRVRFSRFAGRSDRPGMAGRPRARTPSRVDRLADSGRANLRRHSTRSLVSSSPHG